MRLIDSARSRSSSLCRTIGIGVKSPRAMPAVSRRQPVNRPHEPPREPRGNCHRYCGGNYSGHNRRINGLVDPRGQFVFGIENEQRRRFREMQSPRDVDEIYQVAATAQRDRGLWASSLRASGPAAQGHLAPPTPPAACSPTAALRSYEHELRPGKTAHLAEHVFGERICLLAQRLDHAM